MTVATTAPFEDEAVVADRPFSAPWLKRFAFFLLVGLVIICVNFPKFLSHTIDLNVADPTLHAILMTPIHIVQWCLGIVVGRQQAPFFERAIGASFFLLWLFLAALAVLSVRRRSAKMFAYCIGGMVVGYLTLHLLAWAAVTIVVLVVGAISVAGWVVGGIFSGASFLAYYLWPLFLLGALFLAVRNFRQEIVTILRRFGAWIHRHLSRIALGAGGLAIAAIALLLLIRWVIIPIINFLTPAALFVWAVGKWIVFAIIFVVLSILALAITLIGLALVGSLLVSQLQAGWRAARSARDMLVAGFAIGSSLTLIVLVSLATPALADALNNAWHASFLFSSTSSGQSNFLTDVFAATLPGSVKGFVFLHLTNLQAPGFDTFIFLIVMVLALFSVISRIFSPNPAIDQQVPITFVATEYLKMAGGLFVALLLIFAASAMGESQN